jgi:hypothetical protein
VLLRLLLGQWRSFVKDEDYSSVICMVATRPILSESKQGTFGSCNRMMSKLVAA